METYIVKVPVSGNIEVIPVNQGQEYEQIRDAVGGYIEVAPISIRGDRSYTIDCFVDEEGLLKRLPVNARLLAIDPTPFVGNAVFAAHDADGETVGLTANDAKAIANILHIYDAKALSNVSNAMTEAYKKLLEDSDRRRCHKSVKEPYDE